MKWCWWFFHNWTKWKKAQYSVYTGKHPLYDNSIEVSGPPTDANNWHSELRQERTCQNCGRTQIAKLGT